MSRFSFRGTTSRPLIATAICTAVLCLAMRTGVAQPANAPTPTLVTAVECRPRGGLPNFFAKAKAGGDVRVAYLGGSITAAPGWRVFSLDRLKKEFPKAQFSEISAAIGGTGSDLGAFRVGHDVIAHKPDLVFVEFAVNDAGTPPEQILATMEGIVRQILRADAATDICFVYTVSEPLLADLAKGVFPRAASTMEAVADHYAIPSVHYGVEVNRRIAKNVDVMIGNEEDFTACLGLEVEGADENLTNLEIDSFKNMIGRAVEAYPNFKVVATTLRGVKSATVNDWGAICWAGGNFYEAKHRPAMEILDRVGGGDSFASGLIYGFLSGAGPQAAVDYGAAHGALAMTTPGDTSMASLSEVKKLAGGGGARVDR